MYYKTLGGGPAVNRAKDARPACCGCSQLQPERSGRVTLK